MNYDFSALDQATRSWYNVKPKIEINMKETKQGYEISVCSKYDICAGFEQIKVINWVERQLNNVDRIRRKGYNNWVFETKEDLDKFITFFHLRDPANG
jgi:hypothetical protein